MSWCLYAKILRLGWVWETLRSGIELLFVCKSSVLYSQTQPPSIFYGSILLFSRTKLFGQCLYQTSFLGCEKILEPLQMALQHISYHVGINSNWLLCHDLWLNISPPSLQFHLCIMYIMWSQSQARVNISWIITIGHLSKCSSHRA